MDLQLSRRNFLLSSAALGTLAAFGGVNVASADPAEKIVIGRAVDSDDLDPVTCTGNQNIFIFNLILDGLLKSSDDGSSIEPCLATDMPEISEDGKVYTGRGADNDIVVSSARAYVNALNRLLNDKREHQQK